MKTNIRISKTFGMQEGWKTIDVTVSETLYSDKDKMNAMKYSWDPDKKVWTSTFNVKSGKLHFGDITLEIV